MRFGLAGARCSGCGGANKSIGFRFRLFRPVIAWMRPCPRKILRGGISGDIVIVGSSLGLGEKPGLFGSMYRENGSIIGGNSFIDSPRATAFGNTGLFFPDRGLRRRDGGALVEKAGSLSC